jgi:hypothetical protein
MMLLLFVYPMRKHLHSMRSWGATKYWFIFHMVLGIGGPFLILVHSQFTIGSVNAGVALICMLIVAGSGGIGRYLYIESHHGLTGERVNVRELQAQAGFNSSEVKSKLHYAPTVEQRLMQFQGYALPESSENRHRAWRFATLSVRRRAVVYQCTEE